MLAAMLAAMLAVVLAACVGAADLGERPPITSLEVAPTDTTVFVGYTVRLTAIARDERDAVRSDRTVWWTSSDPSVARVDARTGVVTAVAPGSASIYAVCDGHTAAAAVQSLAAAWGGLPLRP
jgi:uncharacterized protein YjdB